MTHKAHLAIGLFALTWSIWADPSVGEIIDRIDTNYQLGSDMTAQAHITTNDPEQGTSVMDAVYYRRDRDNAFLIVIAHPESDRGTGYMRFGDNLWMYKRATRTFTHIGRDQKIGGSNTSVGDVETRKFKELYEPAPDADGKEVVAQEMLAGRIPAYRIVVTAKVSDVKFPKLVMWVTRDKFLEVKRECYSLSGVLLETDLYARYRNVGGKYLPLLVRFTDEVEKGRTTIFEITGVSFDKVDDYKFDKSYLESLSK